MINCFCFWNFKETFPILRKQKFHCRTHKSPPLDSIPSQLNPVHKATPYFFNIYFISFSHIRLIFSEESFVWYSDLTVLATCPTHLIFLVLVILSVCTPDFSVNNSTAQSPFWEVNSQSHGEEIPHLLWNPKVHYRVHKSPSLVHILG
jgi:hypothetical protein